MHVSALAYSLGGASVISTFAATILHGVCYASFHTSTIELLIVSLSAISCIAITLVLLWGRDCRTGYLKLRDGWRVAAYGLILAYLSIATATTAGGMAWSTAQNISESNGSHKQRTLLVARYAIWALSILIQGLFAGFLLTALTKREHRNPWPSSLSLSQELPMLPDESSTRGKDTPKSPSFVLESRRQSLDRKTLCEDPISPVQPAALSAESQSSRRYSGRTLVQTDSKHNSIDFNVSPGLPSPEYAAMANKLEGCQDGPDSNSVTTEDRTGTRRMSRTPSQIKRSLDSLILQTSSGPSSPTAPSTQSEAPKVARLPPKLKLRDESNIHPLFRSDSPSPPPTPTPGSMVIASPAAGQTISVQALNRVRSANSLRRHGPRSRSPLIEQMDQGEQIKEEKKELSDNNSQKAGDENGLALPNFIIAADVRRSTSRYERKYELNESPDES